jgi:hypothetical protein
VIVTGIRREQTATGMRLVGDVRFETGNRPPFTLEWTVTGAEPAWMGDAGSVLLATAVLPAAVLGEDLTIEAPVSPRLAASIQTIVDIYIGWVPTLRRPNIRCETAPTASSLGHRGLFFSCGVDSFHTLMKNDSVSHLIFISGFDVRLGNPTLLETIMGHAAKVAAEAGRTLVVVESNARQLLEPLLAWKFSHGPALASAALAVGGLLGTCLIPSSHAYDELIPWGSHPLLDPLWSTEALEFEHYGCAAHRVDKIRAIADWPLALSHLRVCWPDWTQDYNCGRCEKCVRTMLALHAAGALDRAATFPNGLNAGLLREVSLINGDSSIHFMQELVSKLGMTPRDAELKRGIVDLLRRERRRSRMRALIGRSRVLQYAYAAARSVL